MVSAATLNGNYVIDRFNGKRVSEKYTVSFTPVDSTTLHMHCKVANVMNGTVKMSDNVLTGMLISTLMMGTEEQSNIESAIVTGFGKGMGVTQKGRVLLLHSGSATLRLTAA